MNASGPAELLRRRVEEDPARPLITFYDDASGERVELSARTFDNWVAKTANLLVDGLAAEPRSRVVLALPPHWQTAVWLMACWSAGMVAVPVDLEDVTDIPAGTEPIESSGPYVLVCAEEVLDRMLTDQDAEEIVGLSLHALGGGLTGSPPGIVDYGVEVRGYGDRFVPGPEVTPDKPALSVIKDTLSGTQLARAADEAGEKWGLGGHDRVLTDLPYTTLGGVLAGLLAPLASGASVIIQRNFIKTSLDRRVTVEHVTAVAGVPGWNDATGSVRRLL